MIILYNLHVNQFFQACYSRNPYINLSYSSVVLYVQENVFQSLLTYVELRQLIHRISYKFQILAL